MSSKDEVVKALSNGIVYTPSTSDGTTWTHPSGGIIMPATSMKVEPLAVDDPDEDLEYETEATHLLRVERNKLRAQVRNHRDDEERAKERAARARDGAEALEGYLRDMEFAIELLETHERMRRNGEL